MIETERLRLIALTPRQLRLWAEELPTLERELNATYRAEPVTGVFRSIVLSQLQATELDAENYAWHSFWLIIRNEDSVIIGAADFKDKPDSCGKVEIGYGLGDGFGGSGYMTEAVMAMCSWAFSQPGVTCVTAETEPDNIPSQNILKRCGFTEESRSQTVWWCLHEQQ